MSLFFNKDKLIVNVLVIFSLCLLITPIKTSIDLSFSSFAFKQNNGSTNPTNNFSLFETIGPTVKEIINQTLITLNKIIDNEEPHYNETNSDINDINITKKCYDELYDAYFGGDENRTKFFLTKFMYDSSKSKDELLTYSSCLTLTYGLNESYLNDIVYLEVILDQTVNLKKLKEKYSTEYETLWSVFGICAPIGCDKYEYKRFLYEMIYDLFHLTNSTNQIEVLPMYVNGNNDNKEKDIFKIILQMMPVLLIFIFFLIILFKWFPFCCFKSCFMKNRSSKIDNDGSPFLKRRNSKIYNRTEFNKFKISMSLKTHISELFGKSKYANDTGMTYIKGLRGIGIIFSIFGFLFVALYNNPISIYHEDTFIHMLLNLFFVVFFIGIRYAPRLLFSCSGFCVYYKLICYLDEKSREESERRIEKKKRKQKAKESIKEGEKVEDDESSSSSDDDEEEGENDEKEKNKSVKDNDNVVVSSKVLAKDIKWNFLLRFYLNQIHKYIIFVLFVLIVTFSIIPIEKIFGKTNGPIWNYYKEKIVNVQSFPLMETFLFVRQLNMNSEDSNTREIFVNYLWMISAEMLFFIVGSFVIFVGYKYKYRFNYIFNIGIVIVLVIKIYYLVMKTLSVGEDAELSEEHPTVEYQTLYYSLDGSNVLWNPLFNSIYFSLGTIFGAMNYVFQKKITYEMIANSDRLYLDFPHSILKRLSKMSKKTVYIIGFIALTIIILLSFTQSIYMNISTLETLSQNHCTDFITSKVFNILFYFDVEIVVILFNLLAFGFNLKGNNYMNNMFSHSLWFIFEKLYFMIILLANPIILYILSKIELRITLNNFNIILFSSIALFYVLLFSCVSYVIMELPLKKLIKLIVNSQFDDQQTIAPDEDNNNEEQIDLINYLPILNEEIGGEEEKNENVFLNEIMH